jgi:hypothetical protein
MIELLAQLAFVDEVRKGHVQRSVDQTEGDRCRGPVLENGLTHQEFVEVRVNQGPDNRINLPFVVPDPSCDVDH